MKIRMGLFFSFLVISLQWLAVISFVGHSYTWWLKAGNPVITVSIVTTILFSIGSALAVGFALWAYERLYNQRSRLKYIAQFLEVAGLSGLLVFSGMISRGYVELINR
jgi:hypothetical protein